MTTRVLVVDDDPVIVRLVSAVLQQAGYAVVACSSSLDALKRTPQVQPDLVIRMLAEWNIDRARRHTQLRLGDV